MELQRTVNHGINISSPLTVLSYSYAGTAPIEVMARADLGVAIAGQPAGPIQGNGSYHLQALIGGTLVSPDATIVIAAGVTQTVLMSRPLALVTGDVVSLVAIGLVGDTAVNIVASLRDVTPAKAADVLGGGSVLVDHNHGGTDALTYETAAGLGIPGADIQAFRQSDYNAGNRSNDFVVGRTATDVNGRWARALSLLPGVYVIVFSAYGRFGPDAVTVTV